MGDGWAQIVQDLSKQLGAQLHLRLLISILLIAGVWLFTWLALRRLWNKHHDPVTRYRWRKTLRYLAVAFIVVSLGILWLEGLQFLAAFIALTSAGLAVALRELFVDFTGWLFIIWRHPFGVGDRIQIGTWAGDVVDIRWFQFTILEIANWVDADQSTGRVVHIPNGMVFREPLANYTRGFEYIWNEIPVRLTFDSDWRKAKALLLQIAELHLREVAVAAERHLREEVREYLIFYRNFAPVVYTRGREFGILLTLRYLCPPRQRRGTEHAIWEEILTAFAAEPDIHFAYPTWRVEMGEVKRET